MILKQIYLGNYVPNFIGRFVEDNTKKNWSLFSGHSVLLYR